MSMKIRQVPCWFCKGAGITEEGETVDVGVGSVQISADVECYFCDGVGMIVVNGDKHREYRREFIKNK